MKTPKFNTFFHERREAQREKYKNFIVNEMSLKLDDQVSVLTSDKGTHEYYNHFKKYGDFEETVILGNKQFYVYRLGYMLGFLTDEKYTAAIVEYEEVSNNKIKMIIIDKMRGFYNLMDHIFIDYFLERYDEIESDNVHTAKGFEFYKKLASLQDHYNKYKMYIRGPEGDKPIDDAKQMDTTYGYNPEHGGYSYVLKKI